MIKRPVIENSRLSFQSQFQSRLAALKERQPQVFPAHSFPDEYARAAVLLLFWPGADDAVKVVFTRRTETVSNHRGQVCFPGGVFHAGDKDMSATALRETEEELGIDPAGITIMGRLDDAYGIAGHHVTSFVGWSNKSPAMTANSNEVAEVMVADVRELLRPEVKTTHTIDFMGGPRITHAFDWDGGYVWGLTADILLEFLRWVRDEPSDHFPRRRRKLKELIKFQAERS